MKRSLICIIVKRKFMKNMLLVITFCVLFNTEVFASIIFVDNPEYFQFYFKEQKSIPREDVLQVNSRDYDVLEYDLYLDWYNVMKNPTSMDSVDRIWYGINKISIMSTVSELSNVELDANTLTIDSVYVCVGDNCEKVVPTPKISKGKLNIPLSFKLTYGSVCQIVVYYNYARNIPEENYRGFFLYPKGKFVGRLPAPFYDSVFVEERIAYTMSEPEDARYWMPCNDAPYDKADAKITVRVPKDYIPASNGYLSRVVNDGDTAKIFYWISDKPLTTYLMSVAASKYVLYSDWYRKVSSPNDSIEIQYYVWEKDYYATKTDGSQYNAQNTFKTTPKMLEFFSRTFIEYPFVKYGMVVLMPFHYGGMEHQTITSINRVWLRLNLQSGIAHELAHHWIGNLVTCATWDDIWFNEGGATWSEAIYYESLYGKWGYNLFILSSRREYLRKGGLALPPIYGLPIYTIFGDYSVLVYQKSSWVYHMLKEMLGDTLFFHTLRGFLQEYSFKSITTENFINHFSEKIKNPNVDFMTFFDQWLFKAGHPVFSVSSIVHSYQNDTGYYDAEISISQIQSGNNVPSTFKTPVRLIFKTGDSVFSQTFVTFDRVSIFSTALPFFPDSIFVDTTSVLCEVGDIVLSYNEEDALGFPKVFPNPIFNDQILNIKFGKEFNGVAELSIYDLFGRSLIHKFISLSNGQELLTIPESLHLLCGTYFLKITTRDNSYYFILQKNNF